MKRWDYKVVPVSTLFNEKELKKLGQDGWKLSVVTAEPGTSQQVAVFMCELPKPIGE